MIFIETQEGIVSPLAESTLERAALTALQQQQANLAADLTIVLADDAQLHSLNQQFLEVDAPTDVLSFPSDETDPDTGQPYLGDIILSVERATRQALETGHAPEDELQLLVIHGVLHLLGHDHAEPEEKARMWQAQAEILAELGLAHITIRDE